MRPKFNSVDDYIKSFPDNVQLILTEVRKTILNNAPNAEEKIAYGMPGYKSSGRPLVYFAGYKNHIGFYSTPNGQKEFASEISKYKHGKGSIQFPLDQTIPYDLIARIVEFRVKENIEKIKKKK